MTTEEFIAARKKMGYSRPEMAVALGLRGDHSVSAIERIEAGGTITGPMERAVKYLLSLADIPRETAPK